MSLSRPVLWPGELFFSVIFCNQRSLIALGHVARNPPSPHPIDIKNSYVMLKLQNYFFIISAYVHVKIISLSLLFTLSFKSFFSVNPIISRKILLSLFFKHIYFFFKFAYTSYLLPLYAAIVHL